MKRLLSILSLSVLAACASQPDSIQSAYVSDLQYKQYDCEQLTLEATRISNRVNELHSQLKETVDNDAAQMGVGLILFWPTLFFLEGGDGPQAQEYARHKGERDAIGKVAVVKKCAIEFAPLSKTETAKLTS
ncbi:hypothetical protein OAA86_06470 [Rhodospirillales bacterium]|nr:hypothetical protein [Rhodospirillales bacterium]